MFLSKKVKFTAFCLALLSCLAVMLPGTALADTCAEHDFVEVGTVPATTTEDGSVEYVCSVCGETKSELIPRIGTVTLHAASVSYKAKAQRPDIIITDITGAPISSEYYTVSMEDEGGHSVPHANAIGKYTIYITFQDKYFGVSTLTFKVVPVAVENFTATSEDPKSVTFTYDPVAGAKGYQIYYSAHKHGPYKKLATTSNTTYTYTRLTSGKTYYFKVRAYVNTRSGSIGGEFSGIRKVTVQ